MKTVARTTTPRKPIPSAAAGRTTDSILGRVYTALNDDGSYIVPGSIDLQGMTIIAGAYRFRLELSEAELVDSPDDGPDDDGTRLDRRLDELIGGECHAEPIDRDWMAETDMPF